MIAIVCAANFFFAYTADYLYSKMEHRKFLGLIVFAFGFANFLCAVLLLAKMIRSE